MTLTALAAGPIVSVEVGLSRSFVQSLRSQGLVVPSPVRCAGLLDSGADVTVVEPAILSQLKTVGFRHKRFVIVNAPGLGGLGYHPEYAIEFRIVHPSGNRRHDLALPDFPIVERALGAPSYDVLIGLDVLSSCMFILNGPAGTLTLGY